MDTEVDVNVKEVSATEKIKISDPKKQQEDHNKKESGIVNLGKSPIRRHKLQYNERQEVPTI